MFTLEAQLPPAAGRLLIPVARNGASAGVIGYAGRRAAAGGRVEACLLHVEEALGHWELLKYFRSGELTTRRLIEPVLRSTSAQLARVNVPHAAYLRSGGVVFAILDAAEELNCTEIVVADPTRRWWRLFSGDTVAALRTRQRGVPVVVVAADGSASRPRSNGQTDGEAR